MHPHSAECDGRSGVSPWLASIIMRRGGTILPRFALHYQRLRKLSRPWQRRLRQRLAVTVTGAALLLAVGGGNVWAEPAAPEATIAVVNGEVAIVNNGKCSLIEAIRNAQNTASGQPHTDCTAGNPGGPDTVSLPSGGLFTLTAVNNTNGYGSVPNGLPGISQTITINGNGATIRRAAAAPDFRILYVQNGGNLTLNNVTISGGNSPGTGGGIFVYNGTLKLQNSTITNNYAYDGGGGLHLYNVHTVSIANSTISGNVSEGNGGGIAVDYFPVTSVAITDSQIFSNISGSKGGGLYLHDSTTTISRTTIRHNVAHYDGGGAYLYNGGADFISTTISNNNAGGRGGGLLNNYTETNVVNSTISGNQAQDGGGVFAYYGGDYAPVVLTNSTVTGNSASGSGGGLYAYNGKIDLKRSLVAGNTASGPGDEVYRYDSGGSYEGTITAGNFNLFGRSGINNAAAFTNFTPSGSDINATSSGTNTPLASIIGGLANNGGPTHTHALPAGSPARDKAPNTACTNAPVSNVDQRGEPRNQNGAGGSSSNECDTGAYEAPAGGGGGGSASFYISPAKAGSIGGVSVAPADIIKFVPGSGWSMHFDGSDVGITKNLSAFEIQADNSILLSLGAPQTVSGAGSVAAQDVMRFSGTTGSNTSGTFQMWVDGSTPAVGLTTSGEKIDGLGLHPDGRIAVSTSGALAVPKAGGGTLKAQDEDATGYNRAAGTWTAMFNGTAITGLSTEDINAIWLHPTTGDIYITILGTFNLGGVAGDGKDIVKLTPSGAPGGYTPSIVFDGSAAGLTVDIDGLEMIP